MKQRIFHTIGQGAYYSERLENVNIVFDCGTEWKNRAQNIFDKIVKQSFSIDDSIDILFVSHFDYDHVSKIETLKKSVKEIKSVVLPLLHDNEKILLSNVYRALNIDLLTLINNPEEYFGAKTRVIHVRPTESPDNPINDDNAPQNIDELEIDAEDEKIKIESGKKLSLKELNDWVFIPYNYKYKDNHNDLKIALKAEGFNVDKFTNDPGYTIDEIIKDVSLSKSKGGKKLQNIYDRLEGKINQNSMFLYSGPIQKNQYHKDCFIGNMNSYFYYPSYYYCDNFDKVGCVYTGDSDLNKVDISSVYKRYWDNVGTIQIPHHGDLKSFNKKVLKDYHYCCPISVGKNNSYGHPSNKVIAEILSNRSCPIFISEELNSMFIEIIE